MTAILTPTPKSQIPDTATLKKVFALTCFRVACTLNPEP